MSKSGTRVIWDEHERELMILAMVELLGKHPKARPAALWEAGNALMAPDRKRAWSSSYSGKSNPNGVFFAEARRRHAAGVTGTPVAPPESRAHVPHQPPQQEVRWVPVPTPLTVADVPLNELLAEVFARVLTLYAPAAVSPPPAHEPARVGTLPLLAMPKLAPAVRPVRIALCGPMADQFRRVKERINARKVELVHVDNQKEVSAHDWRGGIDYALVTRFIRHAHTEHAQREVGKERVHWVSQGTDSIVAKISELVPGSTN